MKISEFCKTVKEAELEERPYPHGMACPECGKVVREVVNADSERERRFRRPSRLWARCTECDWRVYRVRLVGGG